MSRDKKEQLKPFVDGFCPNVDAAESFLKEMQRTVREWRDMQNSLLDLVRNGTPEMVETYVSQHPDEVYASVERGSETLTPLTEAVRRCDMAIINTLLSKNPNLCMSECTKEFGCGILTEESSSPLAIALTLKKKEVASALINAHTKESLENDPGIKRNSTFDGESHKSILDLAREWGDNDILRELKAKGLQ